MSRYSSIILSLFVSSPTNYFYPPLLTFNYLCLYSLNTATMVKLQEVEDEHFVTEKTTTTKDNTLLATDDEDEDYTDTG